MNDTIETTEDESLVGMAIATVVVTVAAVVAAKGIYDVVKGFRKRAADKAYLDRVLKIQEDN